MTTEWMIRLAQCVVLVLVQVLFLNHIHLFGLAIPLLYIYIAITFRRGTPKWAALLTSFLLGLVIDTFSGTPGLAAGSLTLIAMVQSYLLELFVPRDSADNMEVSISSLGFSKYVLFFGSLVLLYCLVFFGLESFSFFNVLSWLGHTAASAVLTLLVILAIESVRSR